MLPYGLALKIGYIIIFVALGFALALDVMIAFAVFVCVCVCSVFIQHSSTIVPPSIQYLSFIHLFIDRLLFWCFFFLHLLLACDDIVLEKKEKA